MSVGGGGGGYSGGGGGFSGGFGPPPMFGGGFGQQFPSYGGGFGAFGPQPYSGFGGGFGGGFGMPQQPQYGGGFGGGFGQPRQPQFGGGFGQFQPPQFGGGFDQRGPGNAYARPFPGLQPQPTPPPPPGMEANPNYNPSRGLGPAVGDPSSPFRPIQQANPATGVMPSEPLPDPNDNFTVSTQALIPATRDGVSGYYTDGSMRNFVPNTPTGGGYPSRDQFNQTFQLMPAVERPIQAERAVMPQYERSGLSGLLGGGLGGLFGGYQAMPFGGYQQFDQQYPSNYQAAQQQMALDRQRMQQGNFNQPPPGMKLNPTYDAGYAMAQDMPPPGSPQALRKQQFIPI